MLVDSHAHLDDPAFASDLPAVLERAREAGVERIVSIGTSLESSRRARDIAESRPEVTFSPGIHPHEADRSHDLGELRALAAHPRAVAVGETGLDYVKNYSSVPNQKELFVRHLELALEADKPVSIHCREAHADAYSILRAHAPLRGVIHCFSGTWADAERYLSLNFYLSIAGPVTYPSAQALREVVGQLPLDRLLIETDCPLLPPQKFRGKRNEPAYVRYAAAEIANVLKLPLEQVNDATSRNARNLFGLT
ncbi:MAG TPA: TatD family hydrolase [Planctomycetota bacterium]|jgi:TatD DNase family protein|nr:TatD family hydrolase [Planctomycetota bacterium]